ncbi:RNA-directed DNA polymerase from mobile element jockey [Stylophora pistillata]|uniref:RNA-directed DNA polymerase from mobile element jockey n=1 Tax=Stylophora pistillata TaxID=50429 RepID=A0A2B4R6D2_STYPI|nr:RNA-directed DNA polymerase from mobile element jockey [Stylophora pistillata]
MHGPITVLPILSKLLEKHICDHLCDFPEENALLHRFQSGVRKFHSTGTALIRLVDQLLFDLDKSKVSGLVFIDYKKAFDLIHHGLLLEKLKAYGHSTVDIYADDTTLSLSSDMTNGLTVMSSALQQDLDDVSRWSAANKMVTNAVKTKCLLVTGKRISFKLDNCSLELKLANSDKEQVDSQKLLGVTIDKHLSFDVRVEELCKKLSQRIAVLRKIRRFIPIEQRTLYCNAMIKQVMLYGSTIWSNCSADY